MFSEKSQYRLQNVKIHCMSNKYQSYKTVFEDLIKYLKMYTSQKLNVVTLFQFYGSNTVLQ